MSVRSVSVEIRDLGEDELCVFDDGSCMRARSYRMSLAEWVSTDMIDVDGAVALYNQFLGECAAGTQAYQEKHHENYGSCGINAAKYVEKGHDVPVSVRVARRDERRARRY